MFVILRVTGFIGSSGRGAKPFPLTVDEVIEMLIQKLEVIKKESTTEPVAKKPLFTAPFEIGDIVRVKEGINAGEEGQVSAMDLKKVLLLYLLKCLVDIKFRNFFW
nr:hypothetical protein [Entomoplasma sp. MP1]